MTTVSLAFGRPTLADRLYSRGLVMDLVLISAGAALTSIFAQLSVPLWPVPITGQTLAVLLVGSALGAVRGALSMVLYMALGIAGLPVFSDSTSGFAAVAGPTGGYIVGFIFAAALTGWIAQRSWDRKVLRALLSFLAGTVVTFVFGLPWLAFALGLDLQTTLEAGLYPFILSGVIKAAIAAGVITLGWRFIERKDRRRAESELGA
ncbi:biotin transporter BioY [Cryobacterium sp. BB307]|uniref:biotin transporter BioY n=1 Tax=Cryobacterium sp. BB307 TaxID=2716317 RepID=UPI001447D2B4|nr:biotin transporter BioY [Cryobacterium sp. BB307]